MEQCFVDPRLGNLDWEHLSQGRTHYLLSLGKCRLFKDALEDQAVGVMTQFTNTMHMMSLH